MAVRCLLAAFFLYSNIILSISVKSRNVFVISEDLSDEIFSGFNFNNGNTHLSGLENHTIHAPECDCGPNAIKCSYDEKNGNICLCKAQYSQRDGKCQSCDCGNFWSFSSCSFTGDNKTCNCNDGYVQRNGTCIECDCGPNAIDCRYDETNGNICFCKDTYSQKDGKCESCYCGIGSNCTFINNKKTCNCKDNYREYQGWCEECDCGGRGSMGCSFVNGRKYCHCDLGFAEKDGKCESCNCGNHSSECSFENKRKICSCFQSYRQNSYGECVKCDCGDGAINCEFSVSEKVCTCKSGYIVKYGECLVPDKSSPVSVGVYLIYATYALIGILSLIIFSCILKAFCRKRKSSKEAAASSECGKDIEPASDTTVV